MYGCEVYWWWCIRFRTAVVCEPGKMSLVCSHRTTAVYLGNVCACHRPVYHNIAATVVYLVQRIIAACVVVI